MKSRAGSISFSPTYSVEVVNVVALLTSRSKRDLTGDRSLSPSQSLNPPFPDVKCPSQYHSSGHENYRSSQRLGNVVFKL